MMVCLLADEIPKISKMTMLSYGNVHLNTHFHSVLKTYLNIKHTVPRAVICD